MGATFIEKHVTLNRKKKGIDYYSSLEPKDFKKFVQIIKKSYNALSKNFNNFSKSEKKYRLTVKKHWVANKKINKNRKLIKNIEMKRVNLINSEPILFEKIIGCKVSKDIIEDEPISLKNIKKKNIGLIIVRSNSKRLKKKAFLNINRKNIIDHLIKRIKKSRQIDRIILCTTKNKDDKKLIKIAKNNNIGYFAGSDRDVLKRMLDSLKQINNIGSVIRITGDDILVDPTYLDKAISKHLIFNADYTSSKELPPGTETEVFSYETLKFIFKNAIDTNGTEYLTNYIVDNDQFFFSIKNDIPKRHKIDARLTIDTKKDFKLVKKLLEYMKKINKEYDYTLDDIKLFFSKYPKLKKINNSTKQRNMPLEYNSKLSLKNI